MTGDGQPTDTTNSEPVPYSPRGGGRKEGKRGHEKRREEGKGGIERRVEREKGDRGRDSLSKRVWSRKEKKEDGREGRDGEDLRSDSLVRYGMVTRVGDELVRAVRITESAP